VIVNLDLAKVLALPTHQVQYKAYGDGGLTVPNLLGFVFGRYFVYPFPQ